MKTSIHEDSSNSSNQEIETTIEISSHPTTSSSVNAVQQGVRPTVDDSDNEEQEGTERNFLSVLGILNSLDQKYADTDQTSSVSTSPSQFALPPVTSLLRDDDEELSCVQLESGGFVCQPYQRDVMKEAMQQADATTESTIAALESLHIQVHVVDDCSSQDLVESIRTLCRTNVPKHAEPRCLLYRNKGKLFNIVLEEHSVHSLTRFHEYWDDFSVTQAVVALTVLCRSLPCLSQGM